MKNPHMKRHFVTQFITGHWATKSNFAKICFQKDKDTVYYIVKIWLNSL